MKYTFLLLLFIIQAHGSELNLYDIYSPAARRIDGINFPRNDRYLYRGLQPAQMNYIKATKAMLGDTESNLESPMLFVVKELLKGNTPDILSTLDRINTEIVDLRLMSYINSWRLKNLFLTDEEADKKAFDAAVELISAAFNNKHSSSSLSYQYFDYDYGSRNDWPTGLIYSSIHVEVAKIYSKHIVVFKEQEGRSLDLNFYNKVINDRWIGTNNEFPDKGEFLTPLYIPYSDIVGYQYNRLSDLNLWYVWQDLQPDLDLAFYKVEKNGKSYVLVIDGKNGWLSRAQTIIEENGIYYYGRSTFDPNAVHPTYPVKDLKKPVRIRGIIEVCDPNCDPNTRLLFTEYRFSQTPIDNFMMKTLQRMKVNGKSVQVHLEHPVAAPAPAQATADSDYDALVDEDPKKVLQILASKEDASKVLYANHCTPPVFSNNLTCSRRTNIGPGQMLFIAVPKKFRGKSIANVSITHFQDIDSQPDSDKTGWDSKPAFASFQVYSLDKNEIDNWRFFGGPIKRSPPKGALFSERISFMRARGPYAPAQTLDFDAHAHKGYVMEKASNDPINAYAIRIMNVGSDDLYLQNLTVSFK
ncbi:MAG: hypothetical protein VYA54_08175 [Bdellovibrionota bacterium]|nr:hypothetical protein [Bdellovibrionota bacterium]